MTRCELVVTPTPAPVRLDGSTPPRARRRASAALAALLAAALSPAPARAQQPPQGSPAPPQAPPGQAAPPAPPGPTGVPRGADGALVQPADAAPAPAGRATPPRALNYTPPEYPKEAEQQGIEGSVTLQLDIDRSGRVKQAVVVESGGHGFDESAVAAAQKLEFEPARRADGTPAAARILYRYSFTLKPAAPPPDAAGAAMPAENLRGTVLASGGDVPLAGATVSVARTGGAAPAAAAPELTTDESGAFRFVDLPPGRYQVTIEAPGFEPLSVEEDIAAGEQLEVKYRLLPRGEGLEVTVRGDRPPREVTKRTLEQREINRIPGTNGDALRSLQNLPGVARPPSIAGLLIVRGSGPQDTQTFIDGTQVPLVYHFGGLSSVVPTEMLEKIDFYPGNFSAKYGRVQGGIVDVALRSPKADGEYHGLAQMDLIDARLLLEGPVPFLENVRFAVAGRRSYIGESFGPVLEAAGAGVTQAPVYYDYQALLEAEPTPSSRLRLAFFGSDDALELLLSDPVPNEPALSGNVGVHTAFQRLQVRYDHELTDRDRLEGVVAIGRDDADFGVGPIYFQIDLRTLSGRLEYSRRLSKGATFNTGLDMSTGLYTVSFRGPAPNRPGEPRNQPFSTRTLQEVSREGSFFFPAAYAELELAPSARAKLVPGLRLDYQDLNQQVTVSPRVNGRVDVAHGFPRTTVKGGVGVFHQPPQFNEVIPPLGNPDLRSTRALHYAVGVEQELTRNIEASAEGFYKQLDDLVVGLDEASTVQLQYRNAGSGRVIGGEFLLKYKPDDRFFGWAAYTLSRSTRVPGPGEAERLVSFDQTHILTVLGSYRLGDGWEFGARFRLVSGNLVTPNVCNVYEQTCDPYRTNALFHAPTGTYTPIPFSGTNTERLPAFHQLDLRLDKTWAWKRFRLSAYLDVQNVYNNTNSEAIQYNFNYTARQYVTGLPVLPSFGLRGEF
ncbi:ligand-gated channel protein [Sorangium cellulosum]|uniref:Ligand-gated channel protein n=1 Tax=Sorangium cellulosum TaxID=56 RepID=A0A2L0EQ90_SORCE|nr:TonB-dependent receptor [Sorangium cellulosum]AUX41432.1 ligand-gated channel protein [Sorangium cellulosum]